ncbi:MAG: DUF1634 domain-containing protein [Chloroflexota bacterium]|nr:DUF1634 domain-containing protein [Chloroflexota bacterium]
MATENVAQDAANDEIVGRTLLGGLVVSIAVMVLGLILAGVSGRSASHVLPLDQVATQLGRGNAAAVLDLGILLLFATPVVGVLVALAGFVRTREFSFALIAGLVIVILVIGFVVALQ